MSTYLSTHRYVIKRSVLLLHKYVFTTYAMINNKPLKPHFLDLDPGFWKNIDMDTFKKEQSDTLHTPSQRNISINTFDQLYFHNISIMSDKMV